MTVTLRKEGEKYEYKGGRVWISYKGKGIREGDEYKGNGRDAIGRERRGEWGNGRIREAT